MGSSATEESFVVCNLREGGVPGTNLDSMWNTLEPGVLGRLPSESAALQTALTLANEGAVVMSCVRPDKDAGAIARYRQLDAVRVDGLTTTGQLVGAGPARPLRLHTMRQWRRPGRTLRKTGIR